MAVTQILARVQHETASIAGGDQAAVDLILSLDLYREEVAEDFDWSPNILELALLGIGRPDLVKTVSQAFEGEELLNSSCPFGPLDYQVYSEIKINKAAKVTLLARELALLPVANMSRTETIIRSMKPGLELPEQFSEYVSRYVIALKSFYAAAAGLNQEVVTWWD